VNILTENVEQSSNENELSKINDDAELVDYIIARRPDLSDAIYEMLMNLAMYGMHDCENELAEILTADGVVVSEKDADIEDFKRILSALESWNEGVEPPYGFKYFKSLQNIRRLLDGIDWEDEIAKANSDSNSYEPQINFYKQFKDFIVNSKFLSNENIDNSLSRYGWLGLVLFLVDNVDVRDIYEKLLECLCENTMYYNTIKYFKRALTKLMEYSSLPLDYRIHQFFEHKVYERLSVPKCFASDKNFINTLQNYGVKFDTKQCESFLLVQQAWRYCPYSESHMLNVLHHGHPVYQAWKQNISTSEYTEYAANCFASNLNATDNVLAYIESITSDGSHPATIHRHPTTVLKKIIDHPNASQSTIQNAKMKIVSLNSVS
jgi:hypothetical protein